MSNTNWPMSPKAGWTLAEIYNDIVTIDMVAKGLDVTKSRVGKWAANREENGSPQPIRRVGPGTTALYSMAEWRDWFDRWMKAHETNKNVQRARPHGQGESFWSYFEDP